ncbi:TIM-barrel domain-containing protein [Hymenobacter cheonanensis]|uniref:TIM-barrel domain-containing protein n=1 Tax=Hymenobacter sp. CA2-7 TaxID=3063993 RepID=UPI0027133D46|nr:TIM-barrel domain-containing protein [Hymenobacter sp. CA2-7]MDO7887868.1 glycoside hydrolase family 31 protein [Hymenobacter sp. CA2-7]
MLASFLRRAGWLLPAALFFASPAHAQREGERPPTQAPFGRRQPLAPAVPGGRYKSHSFDVGSSILTIRATDGSARQVQPWANGVVKISYFAPGARPVADSSVSVVQVPEKWRSPDLNGEGPEYGSPPAAFRAWHKKVANGNVQQTSSTLTWHISGYAAGRQQLIVIDKNTLRISLHQGAEALFGEASPAFRRQPLPSPTPTAADTPPGRADELPGTGVRFRLAPGERLYGTGARALPLDRRGYRLELYNQAHYGYQNGEQNLNVTLPVVLSSRGYLLLFDHYAAGYLDLGKKQSDVLEYGAQGLSSLSYFVVTGQSQAEILDRYTALTGRQPLPPRWALGLIQSRFGYRSQAEMLRVASQMRRSDFPLDALVLDLYWFGGTTRQGDFRWDAAHFPDPAGMMRDLKAQGVNTILISEPYVMRTSLNDSLVRTQGLVGTTAAGRPFTVGSFWAGPASILDVFKPAARTWLWAQYRRLHDQGAAGWWSDLGEPENHPLAMHHRLGPTAQVHNAYGMTWAQIFQDNYAKEYPNERLFNLARSGWAGMQRNAVFPWSGDINRSWSGLQAQVPIMLGMGQAGVGYMHSDAGGFGANAIQDPELYTRWLQLAALCPIMRPHSDQVVAPEPYTYPEPYQSIVRKYAHLRMELLPYFYTLAAENTLTGAPLARALDFGSAAGPDPLAPPAPHPDLDAPDEGGNWSGTEAADRFSLLAPPLPGSSATAAQVPPGNQYLLGPNLLVAPINQPGQRRRNVDLPTTPGGWVDFETGQSLPGGQTVGLPAPLGHVPLLARAGAFVPMTAYRASTAAFRPDTLAVRYFPTPAVAASFFTVYEDDGHSAQALTQRQYATLRLTGTVGAAQTVITATVAGTYAGAPARRLVQLLVARVATAPTAVLLGGQPLAATAWHFDAARHELHAAFPLAKQARLTLTGLRLLAPPAAQTDPETLTLTAPDSRTFGGAAGLHYERYVPASTPAPLRIRNARGQVVRELPTASEVGAQSTTWDGRDAQGRPAAPGLYDVELAGQHQRLVRLP